MEEDLARMDHWKGMEARRCGFFSSLPVEEAVYLLASLRSVEARQNEARALAYLRSGAGIARAAGPFMDLLDPARPVVGVPVAHTDGVWLWSSELFYYLEKYHLGLPEEFLEHMAAHGWECPPRAFPAVED